MKRISKEKLQTTELLLKTLQQLVELRDQLEEKDKEEESGDETQHKKNLYELKEDYELCFKWALNLDGDTRLGAEDTKKRWDSLHPGLPIPRVCLCDPEDIGSGFTMLFLMDAYPLFIKEKDKWLESKLNK